ncbi:MAG: LytTR family DNA-binding domain-containing protein [Oscillospiraceae bacterium]|nr:LytTR family DNA-binding domain-containing protein [Oscillospiraceae bacterium]
MISIYLCDDEDAVRHQIRTTLEWKIFIENYDMKVVCSAAGAQELLDAVEDNKRGVYFLDVDLKDGQWDGFLLGRELRRRDPHGILVYITSYGDLAWRTFQYHLQAFDYIVKEPEQIGPSAARCLEEIHTQLLSERRDPEEMFTLRTGEMVRYVPMRDILFFETAPTPHHVLLHTSGSRMDFLGSLNELEIQLGDRFVRTHRAYLVAADKIEAVDLKHNKLWAGGHECLLSRAGKAELRKKTGGSQ